MNNFTEEMIDKYADDLLIGLNPTERKMIQEEFLTIESKMNVVADIPNISDVEPLSYPFEMYIESYRGDDEVDPEIPIEVLLKNCDQYEGREVEVPKVVG